MVELVLDGLPRLQTVISATLMTKPTSSCKDLTMDAHSYAQTKTFMTTQGKGKYENEAKWM